MCMAKTVPGRPPSSSHAACRGSRSMDGTYTIRRGLEVAALGLLALQRLEQRLEVALAEAQRAVPLDELEEHGGAVADRLGEDLQQVAVLVAVDEHATRLQLLDRHPHLADPRPELRVLVVRVGCGEELDALGPQHVDGAENVARGQREVLGAGAVVEVEVLVDLRALLADSGLVERELHAVVAAG